MNENYYQNSLLKRLIFSFHVNAILFLFIISSELQGVSYYCNHNTITKSLSSIISIIIIMLSCYAICVIFIVSDLFLFYNFLLNWIVNFVKMLFNQFTKNRVPFFLFCKVSIQINLSQVHIHWILYDGCDYIKKRRETENYIK